MRWTIPWAALVVVAIFAFLQLDAAQRARSELAEARDARRSSAALDAVRAREPGLGPTARERALDDALAREQAAHREARVRAAQLEAEVAAQRARADRNAALQAAEAARAEALEAHRAEVAANLARTKALLEKGESLVHSEPAKRWLEDVASGDRARVAYARARAAQATAEQVEALRALIAQTPPGELAPAARLAGALPAGPQTAALVGDLVLRLPAGGIAFALDAIPAERLVDVAVVTRVLAGGSNALRREVLVRGSAHRSAWSATERRELAAALLALLEVDDPQARALAARGLCFFRLEGGAERLAALLDHPAAVVRAGAAYGLSGVPDLETVADRARVAVPALLEDADLQVRTAGAILVEALLGERVAFRPDAPPPERAAAIEKIKQRLGP